MTLSPEAQERLEDIVELQPTKNGTLQERWGMDSGSEVHSYLESELKEYYYRNEDSLICATPEAEAVAAGEETDSSERVVDVSDIEAATLDVLPGPDDEPQSVVATLHALQDAGEGVDVDDVRSVLHGLVDKGAVERVRKTVPTFRLVLDRENIVIR
ncbi:DUF5797 family protein [Salinibaculum rarum]|uniref:DUF5797 family protein n=1 Tax=Salinibaculum rarum TaxID=3058903 RepID=UPI00265EE464|nr:DUF5797 family protein [Salinibaculum sp. KK48]